MFKTHLILVLFILGIMSCSKQDNINLETTEKSAKINLSENERFTPSSKIVFEHGMLNFETKEDLAITALEVFAHKRDLVDEWESNIGFTSQQFMFNEVVKAEEAISDYYEELPASEQEKYRNSPEINSEIYEQYLNEGIIKIVTDREDGTEYFDYAVIDPGVAGVINKEGMVKAGEWIYQYTPNAIKIILDGDFSKIEKLKSINTDYRDESIIVEMYEEVQSRNIVENYSDINSWQYPTSKKRVKLWLDGHSESYGGLIDTDCTQFMRCTYTVRSQAQKKNFWGNWKYKSDFSPSLHIDDAVWSYHYGRYIDGYCGLYTNQYHNNIGSYSCTGCSSCLCPTSPHDVFYPSTNNGYFNLTPHGIWSANSSPGYFSDAFDVNYSIPAYYYIYSYTLAP